jgi:hypothetical protein
MALNCKSLVGAETFCWCGQYRRGGEGAATRKDDPELQVLSGALAAAFRHAWPILLRAADYNKRGSRVGLQGDAQEPEHMRRRARKRFLARGLLSAGSSIGGPPTRGSPGGDPTRRRRRRSDDVQCATRLRYSR